ncbi:hypothetical protein BOTBODRAFT_445102 [Botryobasidium botryosum FD-172 SS1]|uniref:Uncharacterized protein n=1 Tax=Botryobasidium botryosum (strain FD-172 SS1) TaxID=930990 RepID=A0A067N690_BOTB1|nr:hypothetical protein BOTBODRAFT_445102 [Botryobasidium botryosum FD-172 SS1]
MDSNTDDVLTSAPLTGTDTAKVSHALIPVGKCALIPVLPYSTCDYDLVNWLRNTTKRRSFRVPFRHHFRRPWPGIGRLRVAVGARGPHWATYLDGVYLPMLICSFTEITVSSAVSFIFNYPQKTLMVAMIAASIRSLKHKYVYWLTPYGNGHWRRP